MAALRRVLVLAPMASELRPLIRYARARRSEGDGLTVHRGRVGDVDVLAVRCGVGPGSSRRTTERALASLSVDHVVVTGIAGGLSLPVGAAVVPDAVLDVASGRRYVSAPMAGVERQGLIATVDRLVTDADPLADLRAQGVVAVEMECSGVAAACEAVAVPWTAFRVISDRPDDGLTDDAVMSLLRPDGTSDVGAALRLVLRHPNRVPDLVRLARDSSAAASQAARRVVGALRATA